MRFSFKILNCTFRIDYFSVFILLLIFSFLSFIVFLISFICLFKFSLIYFSCLFISSLRSYSLIMIFSSILLLCLLFSNSCPVSEPYQGSWHLLQGLYSCINVRKLKVKSVGTSYKQPFKILLIAHNRKNGVVTNTFL
jgi:hypothetical protein